MKVVSYYNVVPSKNKSQEKYDILTKFIKGVNAVGDTGIINQGYSLIDCDVGVIQGWQHELGKSASHLQLRQKVINKTHNKHVCTGDANLFLYASRTNKPHHYLRYSFDGVFPNTGNYFDEIVNPARWQQISKDLDIQIQPYVKTGKNIVICLQRDGGWSMGKTPILVWLHNTITSIRQYSNRTIVIRPHPGDKKAIQTYIPAIEQQYRTDPTVKISPFGRLIEEDLKKAWAVVNHNSSSIVGPIIMGYASFITDPEKSQCAEVSHVGFEHIESPQEFDRQSWLERISMFHWKFTELEDGSAWRHMRNYVRQ